MQPTPYQRKFNFTDYESSNPGEVYPGDKLDSEYNAIKLTTDQIRENLKKIQRDDGRIGNSTIYLSCLTREVLDYITSGGGTITVEDGGGGGGGGTTTIGGQGAVFLWQLLDVPDSYVGQSEKLLRVKSDESGVEFYVAPTQISSILQLSDVPDSFSGQAGKVLRVKDSEDFVEFVNLNIVPGADYARLDQGNDFNGYIQDNVGLKDMTETVVDLGSISGTVSVDLSNGTIWRGTATGACNFVLTGIPTGTNAKGFTMRLINLGAYSHSWFAGTEWGGTTPTFSATGASVVSFVVYSDGVIDGFKIR